MARSNAEEHIFKDSGDYACGISTLAGLVQSGLILCHQFCFMATHYHLLATFSDISTAMHKLNRRYATAFNRRHNRRGSVFDSPYKAVAIESERQLFATVRYIALNPEEPETWAYASYPSLIGTGPAFSFVDPTPILEAFGCVDALRMYVDEKRLNDENLPD